jgi:hypothetical protein
MYQALQTYNSSLSRAESLAQDHETELASNGNQEFIRLKFFKRSSLNAQCSSIVCHAPRLICLVSWPSALRLASPLGSSINLSAFQFIVFFFQLWARLFEEYDRCQASIGVISHNVSRNKAPYVQMQ